MLVPDDYTKPDTSRYLKNGRPQQQPVSTPPKEFTANGRPQQKPVTRAPDPDWKPVTRAPAPSPTRKPFTRG